MADWNKGKGFGYRWLIEHIGHQGDDCLKWPMYRLHGYGNFGYLGKRHYAHRFMCELVYGPPPSPRHEAAHSCGRGHEGCVNPKHLSWKTKSENLLDCSAHGTQARSHYGTRGKLTKDQADEIRGLKGVKTQWQIAEIFDISESTVSDIWLGRTHTRAHKKNYWSPEEDAKLLEGFAIMTAKRLGDELGRSAESIYARVGRLRNVL